MTVLITGILAIVFFIAYLKAEKIVKDEHNVLFDKPKEKRLKFFKIAMLALCGFLVILTILGVLASNRDLKKADLLLDEDNKAAPAIEKKMTFD